MKIAWDSGRVGELARMDWRIDQYNSLWINLFSGTIVWLASFGVNQLAIQRYASLPSLKHAQGIILYTLAPFTVLCSIVAFVGFIALAYFFNCNPLETGEVKESDHITIIFARDILREFLKLMTAKNDFFQSLPLDCLDCTCRALCPPHSLLYPAG